MLKSVFGTNMITEIHASLNNIDKLRYLIARIQKQQNPHGQGILGVIYDFNQNTQEIKNYIQKISEYNVYLFIIIRDIIILFILYVAF